MGWTEERIAALKSLWEEGLSASQIAARLGGVTRNAVIGKVHRLGLSGRPSPLRAEAARTEAKAATAAAAPQAPRPAPQPTLTVVRPAPVQARPAAPIEAVAAVPAPAPVVVAAPQAVAKPVAVVPSGNRVSLLNITDRMCKWPLGHPGEPDFHFCGDRSLTGQPYCQTHASMAYQHAAPRRDKQRNGSGGASA